MDLKEQQILGETISEHWYYKSKLNLILDIVKEINPINVLDVGAGSGYFSKEILAQTSCQSATCVDLGYVREFSEDIVDGKRISYTTKLTEGNFDLVIMIDLLEHVDDIKLLNEYINKVKVGTHFIIIVPAFNFLWSDHDVFLEHKRRYTLTSIRNVLDESRLHVYRSHYFYALLFPLVCIIRLFGKAFRKTPRSSLRRHSTFGNALLSTIMKFERTWAQKNNLFGLSCVCIAKK